MNWQGIMDDLPVALIMMIVAAILGGWIIWLIKQMSYRRLSAKYDQKVGEYSELSNQHNLTIKKNTELSAKYDEISTKYLEVEDKYNIQKKQLQECSQKRTELESEVTVLSPFKRKFEDVSALYENLTKENDDMKVRMNSLQVKHDGLADALKSERDENMKLNTELLSFKSVGSASVDDGPGKEKEDEVLARVQAKADKINFGRIGTATLADRDDLKRIKGIGPFIEKKLNALSIFTFRQIANFTGEDEETVTDAIEFFPGRIGRDEWVPQAKGLIGTKPDKESATLERIRNRAKEINFDRIGMASADDRDDLKRIKGIGPFIEKKLNSIGIYTFLQISKFTPEDEDKVNEVIEFFPGRIRRDEWSKQAAQFHKEKE